MYFVMCCFSPEDKDHVRLSYKRDHPLRSWSSGKRFSTNPNDPVFRRPPPEPIRVEVVSDYKGSMAEFWDDPVPLMTQRLLKALQAAGVTNLDTYRAEIVDPKEKKTYDNYVAFNLIGVVAAADLKKSRFDPATEPLISRDFDALAVDENATRGALMFRLAESVNAIMVHENIKKHLEAGGIDTLTFVPPDQWGG
jgi:hypothetical protein